VPAGLVGREVTAAKNRNLPIVLMIGVDRGCDGNDDPRRHVARDARPCRP
jgi:hypothetical protein